MLRLLLMPIFAGVIATGGITAFLWAVNRSGSTNADMVRAVGSLITKTYDNALGVGLIVHFLSGVIIAAVYLHVFSLLHLSSLGFEIFVGGALGFGHGFIVSYGIIKFAHRHPVQQFQDADYQVAIAHTIGHVIYGVLMGALFGGMRLLGFDVSPGI